MTHSLNRRLSIGIVAMLAVAAAGAFASPAHSATPPSFSIDDATATENSGTIVFKIRKHGHLNNQPSILNLYPVDGTAKWMSDFDSINQSVTFTAAETVKYVSIHLINDNVPEPTETFTAKLRAVSNARLYDGTAIGTITDSDVAPTPPPAVTWTKCADENGTCYVAAPANVRYGSGATWTASRSVTGSIACNNATWGDPLAGTVKECDTDGTAAPAPAPTPTPVPTTGWISAPLADGGYAMCNTVGGCHSIAYPCPLGTETFPPTCSYPNIIAAKGDVRLYMWVGYSVTNRYTGGFWPIGQYGQAGVGYEGYIDEWGGVMPVASAPTSTRSRMGAVRPLARRNLDDRYEAVAVKNCLTPDPYTGNTSSSMSGVNKGGITLRQRFGSRRPIGKAPSSRQNRWTIVVRSALQSFRGAA
jgi:hypothetical protein